MALADRKPNVQPNATMIFQAWLPTDTGIDLEFLCPNPGPGQESLYTISLTDAELLPVNTQAQLRNLVAEKLQRKLRGSNMAPKLDAFLGQSITV